MCQVFAKVMGFFKQTALAQRRRWHKANMLQHKPPRSVNWSDWSVLRSLSHHKLCKTSSSTAEPAEPEHRNGSLHCDLIVCLFSNHPFVPARASGWAAAPHRPSDWLFCLVLEPRRPSLLHNGAGRRAGIRIRKSISETWPTCTCAWLIQIFFTHAGSHYRADGTSL